MKFISLPVLLLAGAMLCAAQATPPAPAEKIPARIEGRTVNAVDNSPLRNVEIVLAGNETEGTPQATKTDAEGHFSLPKLAPGTYFVSITRNGFVAPRSGRAPLTNGRTIRLGEGEKLVDITIPLSPAAVIRGKVLDPNGEPVTGAQVTVLRPGRTKRGGRWNGIQPASTDDTGEFRLFGIPPGKYLVMATSGYGTMAMVLAGSPEAKESRTVPTYYPGVADPKQAAPVTLKPGDELPLNLVLTKARTVHVRGSVAGKMGEKTAVVLIATDEFFLGGQAEVKDGKFDIAGVTPGRYMLQAVTISEGDTQPRMGRQIVEVGPTGADNINVLLGGHARLSGTISAEDGKLDPKKIHMNLVPAESSDTMGGFAFSEGERDNGRVNADGSFQFKEIEPGRYRFAVAANSSGLEDWYTKSIRLGTQDVTYSAIEVPPEGNVAVQVVLSSAGGTIEGIAVDDKEKPWPNATIVAVPESKRRQDDESYGRTASDQRGHFKMPGLAPGDYTVFALEDDDLAQDLHNSETFQSLEASGLKVKVEERSKKTAQPKVIPVSDDFQ